MYSIRLLRITPHPMVYMLGPDRRENNDGGHKVSLRTVVSSDNSGPR
jgi:hypothetical protein